jgi:hypothetical protein
MILTCPLLIFPSKNMYIGTSCAQHPIQAGGLNFRISPRFTASKPTWLIAWMPHIAIPHNANTPTAVDTNLHTQSRSSSQPPPPIANNSIHLYSIISTMGPFLSPCSLLGAMHGVCSSHHCQMVGQPCNCTISYNASYLCPYSSYMEVYTTLNMIFSVLLYLVLLPPYLAQH